VSSVVTTAFCTGAGFNLQRTWDDLICQGIRRAECRDRNFRRASRWGTTLLPGSDIHIDDLYTETSMSYPSSIRLEFTGAAAQGHHGRCLATTCSTRIRSCSQGGEWSGLAEFSLRLHPGGRQWRTGSPTCGLTGSGELLEGRKTYTVGCAGPSVNEGGFEGFLASLRPDGRTTSPRNR